MDPYRFVCPECGITRFRRRKSKQPTYKCRNGHEFDRMLDKKYDERIRSRLKAKQ